MNGNKTFDYKRIGVLAVTGFMALLIGGAIYAQNGPGRGGGFGPGGGGQGFGDNRGPGGPGGPGDNFRGAAIGMLMQDKEIRDLIGKIKLIDSFNKIDLSVGQAEALLDAANELNDIVGDPMQEACDLVEAELEQQLDAVLDGDEFDMDALRELGEEIQQRHEPGELRDQIHPILEDAIGIFTDEQLEILRQNARNNFDGAGEEFGPGRGDGQGQGPRFEGLDQLLGDMDPELRAQVEEHIRGRLGQNAGGMEQMILGRILMAPFTVDALELYIDNQ
jgi:hypothetical protein